MKINPFLISARKYGSLFGWWCKNIHTLKPEIYNEPSIFGVLWKHTITAFNLWGYDKRTLPFIPLAFLISGIHSFSTIEFNFVDSFCCCLLSFVLLVQFNFTFCFSFLLINVVLMCCCLNPSPLLNLRWGHFFEAKQKKHKSFHRGKPTAYNYLCDSRPVAFLIWAMHQCRCNF